MGANKARLTCRNNNNNNNETTRKLTLSKADTFVSQVCVCVGQAGRAQCRASAPALMANLHEVNTQEHTEQGQVDGQTDRGTNRQRDSRLGQTMSE